MVRAGAGGGWGGGRGGLGGSFHGAGRRLAGVGLTRAHARGRGARGEDATEARGVAGGEREGAFDLFERGRDALLSKDPDSGAST